METLKKTVTESTISIETHVWVTGYSVEIPVKQMSTDHVRKCIACFNGVGDIDIPHDYLGGKEKWLKIFTAELISRS
jgi:hypothetical protein